MILDECKKFADEFDGQPVAYEDNLCMALRMRNLDVTIQGHSSKSPLVLASFFSYEKIEEGEALCLLQIPVTENEIDLIVPILRSLDIKIDGLNSRFLKTDPPMYYVTGHIIDDPTIFAINISHIFNILKL
jgi:hypothetical protein